MQSVLFPIYQKKTTYKIFIYIVNLSMLFSIHLKAFANVSDLKSLQDATFKLLNQLENESLEISVEKMKSFQQTLSSNSNRNERMMAALALSAYYVGKKSYQQALFYLNLANDLVQKSDPIAPIVYLHRAMISFEAGSFHSALQQAKQMEHYDKFLGTSLALYRSRIMVDSLFYLGRYKEIIEHIDVLQKKFPNSFPNHTELNTTIAKTFSKYQPDDPRKFVHIENAAKAYPFSEKSIWAFQELARFSCKNDERNFDHKQVQHKNYHYAESLLSQIARNATNDPEIRSWLTEQIQHPIKNQNGETVRWNEQDQLGFFINNRLYPEAYTLSQKLITTNNPKFDQAKLLLQAARSAAEMEQNEKAVEYYRLHAQKFYGGNFSPKTAELVGFALARSQKFQESSQVFETAIQRGGVPEYLRWHHFWSLYRANNWHGALKVLSQKDYVVPQDPSEPNSLLYWKAKILEKTDLKDEAKVLYGKLLGKDPKSFYAALIRDKMPQLDPIPSENSDSVLTASLLGVLPKLKTDQKIVDLKENPYPLVYEDYVNKAAESVGMNRYLIFSIMRAESRFVLNATSPVGAKGLLQIMPYTSAKIAADINHHAFSLNDLESPEINISYGSYYLAYLLKIFGNNPVIATAAYNAGPHAVNKWLERCGNCSVDEFVESIPYRETRRYVKEVFRNLRSYLAIHESVDTINFKWELPKPVQDSTLLY